MGSTTAFWIYLASLIYAIHGVDQVAKFIDEAKGVWYVETETAPRQHTAAPTAAPDKYYRGAQATNVIVDKTVKSDYVVPYIFAGSQTHLHFFWNGNDQQQPEWLFQILPMNAPVTAEGRGADYKKATFRDHLRLVNGGETFTGHDYWIEPSNDIDINIKPHTRPRKVTKDMERYVNPFSMGTFAWIQYLTNYIYTKTFKVTRVDFDDAASFPCHDQRVIAIFLRIFQGKSVDQVSLYQKYGAKFVNKITMGTNMNALKTKTIAWLGPGAGNLNDGNYDTIGGWLPYVDLDGVDEDNYGTKLIYEIMNALYRQNTEYSCNVYNMIQTALVQSNDPIINAIQTQARTMFKDTVSMKANYAPGLTDKIGKNKEMTGVLKAVGDYSGRKMYDNYYYNEYDADAENFGFTEFDNIYDGAGLSHMHGELNKYVNQNYDNNLLSTVLSLGVGILSGALIIGACLILFCFSLVAGWFIGKYTSKQSRVTYEPVAQEPKSPMEDA